MAQTPMVFGISSGMGGGTMNAKNLMISPAVTDLGLGDSLRQQLQDDLDERKKAQNPAAAASGLGNTAMPSPAVLSLFGTNRSF